MRHLKTVSYAITGLGIALVATSLLLNLDPTYLLIGLMLVIAGGVKIGMVALWNGVAGFGATVDTEPVARANTPVSNSKQKGGRP